MTRGEEQRITPEAYNIYFDEDVEFINADGNFPSEKRKDGTKVLAILLFILCIFLIAVSFIGELLN